MQKMNVGAEVCGEHRTMASDRITNVNEIMTTTSASPLHASLPTDPKTMLLNGSASLRTQMLAKTMQQPAVQSGTGIGLPQQQLGAGAARPRPQLDPNILSRMVTASGPGGANGLPIRVASMQDFRRSMNSLSAVPESQPRTRAVAPNQAFALNMNGRPNTAGSNNMMGSSSSQTRPMSSNNPLLKMMEERMAAKKAATTTQGPALPTIAASPSPPPLPPMSEENKSALQASISKWSGIGNAAQKKDAKASVTSTGATGPPVPPGQSVIGSPQQTASSPATSTSPSGRVPLSSNQIQLLKELTESQKAAESPSFGVDQTAQNQQLLQLLMQERADQSSVASSNVQQQQVNAMGQYSMANAQQQQVPQQPAAYPAGPGLTRCAVSLAEVDRLRRENSYVQLRQQMLMQERAAMQGRYTLQRNVPISQRNVAANGLLSMQNDDGEGLTQEKLNALQVNALNQIKRLSSTDLHKGGLKPSTSSSTLRKRRSSLGPEDDDTSCSRGSMTSHTQSINSTASSHKIHRSLSHCSARSAIAGSMENLRIASNASFHLNRAGALNGSNRNQSFSSGLSSSNRLNSVRNQSFSSGLNNMKNQSFSSGSNNSSRPRLGSQHSSQSSALRRTSSNNLWIKSLLSEQTTAGKAAATFEQALQTSTGSNLASTVSQNVEPQSEIEKMEVTALPSKPIQVQAEEYTAPAIERPSSTNTETVIISAVPDSIKYKNSKDDTKPIDIVKEALSSRGAKCNTRPSMDMEDDFFVKVTEMYDQEIVNSIRSNDVDSLRKLFDSGITLQCGNRFGETLIHLACRRSTKELVSFLIKEAGVSLRVRDDFGRTPMHDCCWRAEPDLELLDMLIDQAPELLMLSDKRGHTPLDYSRREHWATLVPFLLERTSKFQPV